MTYKELWQPLTSIYDENEARAVVRLVLEKHYGLTMSDIVLGKEQMLPAEELQAIIEQLLTGEPVQYVLGLAEFGPHCFRVAPGVLIPRPETYELCRWILQSTGGQPPCAILDIGTGSGCIACTLAAALPQATVTAWDISEEALRIARKNAECLGVTVTFEQVDVLNMSLTSHPSPLTSHKRDLIVSNPPYICQKERAAMEQNVLEHEPSIALFVPDNDPLLFYRAIAELGQQNLKPDGWLYFEINPLYAGDMLQLLSTMSYHDIEIKEDQFGKQRMIRAQR
jgi:release factor glutamine methyltransferase